MNRVGEQVDRPRRRRKASVWRVRSPVAGHHRVAPERGRLSEAAVRGGLRRAAVAGAASVVGLRGDGKPITDRRSSQNVTATVANAWSAVGQALRFAMSIESDRR